MHPYLSLLLSLSDFQLIFCEQTKVLLRSFKSGQKQEIYFSLQSYFSLERSIKNI